MSAAPVRSELEIAADAEGERRAAAWIEQECGALDIPPAQAYRLDTCISETLANVIAHGGELARAFPVKLALHGQPGDGPARAVMLSISDHGLPFDPLAAPLKPRPTSLDEASPGGLGLGMIRQFSDDQHYVYADEQNHLTLWFRWTTSG